MLLSFYLVPTTPACTWWNHPEEYLSSGKFESTHPSRTNVKSVNFFMESSQSCAATLTHYSTKPLTTGADFDPLHLLICVCSYLFIWFQRLQHARGGTTQKNIFHLGNWSQLIHPGPTSSRSIFFMEASQSCATTLTHYSTKLLTTGADFDPLHLLIALAGDVHPSP